MSQVYGCRRSAKFAEAVKVFLLPTALREPIFSVLMVADSAAESAPPVTGAFLSRKRRHELARELDSWRLYYLQVELSVHFFRSLGDRAYFGREQTFQNARS
jgi:hypothetical protein